MNAKVIFLSLLSLGLFVITSNNAAIKIQHEVEKIMEKIQKVLGHFYMVYFDNRTLGIIGYQHFNAVQEAESVANVEIARLKVERFDCVHFLIMRTYI